MTFLAAAWNPQRDCLAIRLGCLPDLTSCGGVFTCQKCKSLVAVWPARRADMFVPRGPILQARRTWKNARPPRKSYVARFEDALLRGFAACCCVLH